MRVRTLHRTLGIILLLPFCGWAITGMIFFIKPGYSGAYEILTPRTYPLDVGLTVNPDPGWKEFRCLRTILGDHLLVLTDKGFEHLDPKTKLPRNFPSETELKTLVRDAISVNPKRYGDIVAISGNRISTSTGVRISLDWTRLTLQQAGKDTERIDSLYRIHYLQLTGIKIIDNVLGAGGLSLVLLLTMLGAWLAFKRH